MSKVYNDLEVGTKLRYTGRTDSKFINGRIYEITEVARGELTVDPYGVRGITGHTWVNNRLENMTFHRSFELVQEGIKVGDTVRRTEFVPVSLQTDHPIMQIGAEFVVTDVDNVTGGLYFAETGSVGWWLQGFQKVEKPVVERLAANVAAELLIEGTEPLQYYMSGVWNDVKHPRLFTIAALRDGKFRRKPKTIEINGASVPAPLDARQKEVISKAWTVHINTASVHPTYSLSTTEFCWATEEDAIEVLDAMLLPFKDL